VIRKKYEILSEIGRGGMGVLPPQLQRARVGSLLFKCQTSRGWRCVRSAIIMNMEPSALHISEADLTKDIRSILRRVQTGTEVIIERDAQPVAVLRPIEPVRRKIS
jgi:hypothetical protein